MPEVWYHDTISIWFLFIVIGLRHLLLSRKGALRFLIKRWGPHIVLIDNDRSCRWMLYQITRVDIVQGIKVDHLLRAVSIIRPNWLEYQCLFVGIVEFWQCANSVYLLRSCQCWSLWEVQLILLLRLGAALALLGSTRLIRVSRFDSSVFEFILDLWARASYFSVKLVRAMITWSGLRVAFVKLVVIHFFHQHLLHLPSGSSLSNRVLSGIDLSGIHRRMLNNRYPLTTSLPSRSLTWLTIHASRCSDLLRRVVRLGSSFSFFWVIRAHLGYLSSLDNAFRHLSTDFILCLSCMVDNASASCWSCFRVLIHNITSNPSMCLIWWLITLYCV